MPAASLKVRPRCRAPAEVGVGADAEGDPRAAVVRGMEWKEEPETGDAVGVSPDEPRRRGLQEEEDQIDVPVVVPRVRQPVRPVAVEPAEVDLGVGRGRGEDLPREVAEDAFVPLAEVGRGGARRGVDPAEGLPLQKELPSGHLAEEVGQAARQVRVEEVPGPGRGFRGPRLVLEAGEDGHRPHAAPGGQEGRRGRARRRVEAGLPGPGGSRPGGQEAPPEQEERGTGAPGSVAAGVPQVGR